jgi:arginine exporter protein ArgO
MNHNDSVVWFFLVGFITQLTQEKAEMSHENSWRVIYFEV